MADRVIEELDEDLVPGPDIRRGGIGRIAYASRFGPAVLPVNYALQDGAVVFCTAAQRPARLRPADRHRRRRLQGGVRDRQASTWPPSRAGACSSRARLTTSTGTEQDAVRRAGVEPWAPVDRGSCSSGSSRLVSPGAASGLPEGNCPNAWHGPGIPRGFAISTGYPRLAPLAGTGRGSSVCLSLSVVLPLVRLPSCGGDGGDGLVPGGRHRASLLLRRPVTNRKIEPRPATAPRPKAAREMMKAPGQTQRGRLSCQFWPFIPMASRSRGVH